MAELRDLDATDGNNTTIGGIGSAGTSPISNFDNVIRAVAGMLKRMVTGAAPLDDTVTFCDPVDTTKSRIIGIWDQNDSLGSGGGGYDYGAEWTREQIDAAILDVDLHGEDVFPVADALQERGVLALMAGNLVIRLLPPMIYGQEQVDELLTAIEDVLGA